LLRLIKVNKGLILSSQVDEYSIPRNYLSLLIRKNRLVRIARGVYLAWDAQDDEMFRLQVRYGKGIFSHRTALHLHGLMPHSAHWHTMTFPSFYHADSLREEEVEVYYVDKNAHQLGVIELPTTYGRPIRVYDPERTICDLIRNRNRMQAGILTDALHIYVKRKDKNVPLLLEYAQRFRLERIVRRYVDYM
jgi:predicted transcriptional regulator of viral defense system